MSIAFVIAAEESSIIETNAPTLIETKAAFEYAARGQFPIVPPGAETPDNARQRTNDSGNWVGPAPRFTRATPFGSFVTRATWVWFLNDAQQATTCPTPDRQIAFRTQLAADVATSLNKNASHNTLLDAWTVRGLSYNPTANGSLEWWNSGAAARESNFVDEFPQLLSRLDALDNPIGPNAEHGHSPAGGGPDTGAGLISAIKFVAVAATAIAVVYAIGQIAPTITLWQAQRSARSLADSEARRVVAVSNRPARSNPRRRIKRNPR